MTKLRTNLGGDDKRSPFPKTKPAQIGERSERRGKMRAVRHRKARREQRAHWRPAASSCDGKLRRTEHDARIVAARLSLRVGEPPMEAYACGYCGWYHIGHNRNT